ncbi:hypothetical protein LCGC14_2177550, partial [marine sediment metagenome]
MALGDISAVIDSLEFDTDRGQEPYIIHISGDVFVVVYVGVDFHGWMVTFTVDSSGTIGNSVIDSFEFDEAVSLTPRILNISGDTFVIVYYATGSFTKIITIDIDSSGNIAAAITDSLAVAASVSPQKSEPRITPVSGDIYAVVHRNATNGGEAFTVDIDSSGNIGGAAIDSLEFDAVTRDPDIINVSGTMFAVVYQGPDQDGWVATFNIAADGTIDNTVTNTLEYDTTHGTLARILNVSGDVYVISYSGQSPNRIAVKTLTISAAGAISSVIDTLSLGSTPGSYSTPTLVSGNVYAVIYKVGLGPPGFVATFTISSAGAFSAVLDTLELDPVDVYPDIITVPNSTVVCVVYGDGDLDGFAKTASVDVGSPTVTTQAVTSILETTATGNGNVTDLGDSGVTQHGHCWATSTDPTTSDSKTTNGAKGATGAFTSSITGLSTGITYFVRAYATNLGNTSYGDNVTFETDHVPTVTTDTCENVAPDGTTATGRGNITDLGGDDATAHGHCWDTSINPTTANDNIDNGAASVTGTFTSAITGLTPGTVYYTRAFATNTVGITYGGNVRFTASLERAGIIWMEGSNFRGFDEN